MQTARIVFTVIIALVLMGCPPPVSDNSASDGNAPPQNGNNPDDSASGGLKPEPKAVVVPDVSAGENHTMVLKANGSLWAFGRVIDGLIPGQVGDNQIGGLTPVAVKTAAGSAMTGVKQVSSGAKHTMILKENGDLWAIGSNSNGQLGNGESGRDVKEVTPVQVLTVAEGPAMTTVKQVSSGARHSMILKTNGELWAVGANASGQLGDNTTGSSSIPVAVLTAEDRPMTAVKQVSAGNVHSMILKENGDLWAVGYNSSGQLGDDTTENKLIPVQVLTTEGRPMTAVKQVSAGATHTMILKENGDLWAVGNNSNGQLGDNTTANKLIPVAVLTAEGRPMTAVKQVSAGAKHTMILKENGDLWAVGNNSNGQLGDGSTTDQWTPVAVMIDEDRPMTNVAQVSAGGSHTIIVKKDGSLWAVGKNKFGQLGAGNEGAQVSASDSNSDVNLADQLLPVEITVP